MSTFSKTIDTIDTTLSIQISSLSLNSDTDDGYQGTSEDKIVCEDDLESILNSDLENVDSFFLNHQLSASQLIQKNKIKQIIGTRTRPGLCRLLHLEYSPTRMEALFCLPIDSSRNGQFKLEFNNETSIPTLKCLTYCGRGTYFYPQELLDPRQELILDYNLMFVTLSKRLRACNSFTTTEHMITPGSLCELIQQLHLLCPIVTFTSTDTMSDIFSTSSTSIKNLKAITLIMEQILQIIIKEETTATTATTAAAASTSSDSSTAAYTSSDYSFSILNQNQVIFESPLFDIMHRLFIRTSCTLLCKVERFRSTLWELHYQLQVIYSGAHIDEIEDDEKKIKQTEISCKILEYKNFIEPWESKIMTTSSETIDTTLSIQIPSLSINSGTQGIIEDNLVCEDNSENVDSFFLNHQLSAIQLIQKNKIKQIIGTRTRPGLCRLLHLEYSPTHMEALFCLPIDSSRNGQFKLEFNNETSIPTLKCLTYCGRGTYFYPRELLDPRQELILDYNLMFVTLSKRLRACNSFTTTEHMITPGSLCELIQQLHLLCPIVTFTSTDTMSDIFSISSTSIKNLKAITLIMEQILQIIIKEETTAAGAASTSSADSSTAAYTSSDYSFSILNQNQVIFESPLFDIIHRLFIRTSCTLLYELERFRSALWELHFQLEVIYSGAHIDEIEDDEREIKQTEISCKILEYNNFIESWEASQRLALELSQTTYLF